MLDFGVPFFTSKISSLGDGWIFHGFINKVPFQNRLKEEKIGFIQGGGGGGSFDLTRVTWGQVGPLTRPGRSSLSGREEILLGGVLWTPPTSQFCDGELVWSTGCTLLLVPTCEYPQPQTNDHVRFIVPHYCTYLVAFAHPAHSRSPLLGTRTSLFAGREMRTKSTFGNRN